MFTGEEFPNADYYRSDLRKVLKTVRELETKVNEMLQGVITEMIEKYISSLMFDAIYDEENEEIIISTSLIGGDVHRYDAESGTMYIEE